MLMRPSNKIFKPKAQALLELAIFATIILFLFSVLIQYGMSLNLQQHLTMQTFRKALSMAKIRSKGPSGASLTVVKDSPIPDPSSPFGISETSPVVAQGSGVWSRDLMMEPEILDSELPRVDFIIDGTPKTYTTAQYRYHDCNGRHIRKKETNYDNVPLKWDDPAPGKIWYWEMVEDKKLRNNDYIDIDNDNKVERIAKTDPEDPEEDDDIDKFWYLDFQEGQIDASIDLEEGTPHGLQPEYTKRVEIDGTIQKIETPSGITSSREATVTEIIKRKIKTRAGDEAVSSTVTQTESSDWQTGW